MLVFFSYWLNRYIASINQFVNFKSQLTWWLVLVLSVLTYYSPWLTTPSYNFFVLTGCLLVAGCCKQVLCTRISDNTYEFSKRNFVNILCLSLGLFLCIISKTPSSVILGLTLLVFLFNVLNYKTALSILLSVFVLVAIMGATHVFLFEKSLSAVIDKVIKGLGLLLSLNTSHGIHSYITKLNYYFVEFFQIKYILILISFVLICMLVKYSKSTRTKLTSIYESKYYAAIYLLILFFIGIGLHKFEYFYANALAKGGLVFVFFMLFSEYIFNNSQSEVSEESTISFQQKFLFVSWLISFSIAFSIGSSSHPLLKMSNSWIFGVAALVYLIRLNPKLISNSYGELMSVAMLIWMVWLNQVNAKNHPYRLNTGLGEQTIKTQVPLNGGFLYLDKRNFEYISEIRKVAQQSAWKENTPLIDLTGETPFISYFLNAKVVVIPWLFGPQSGGNQEFLLKTLNYANVEDINSAWLLVEPYSKQKYDVKMLSKIEGYKIKDYKFVGGFNNGYTNAYQVLLRPDISSE